MSMNDQPLPLPRLSCQRCRQRKIKCDRDFPCHACEKSGVICETIQRKRLPRGSTKSGGLKASNLNARIMNLEGMVAQLKSQANRTVSHDQGIHESSAAEHLEHTDRISISGYIAPSFWEALSEQVMEIREILEPNEDDETTERLGSPQRGDEHSTLSPTNLLFGLCDLSCSDEPLLESGTAGKLLSVYQERVDSIFKVLYWPAVVATSKKDPSQRTRDERALEASIRFTAACTLSDAESEDILLSAKHITLPRFRSCAEILLVKTQLLEKPCLTTLQALMIYLVGLRRCSQSASSWHLLAVAVRIATGLGLGSERTATQSSTIDMEIRRRIWYSLGVLDSQSALDRGSLPLLCSKDFTWPLPLSINDRDVISSLETAQGFTEMSFSCMTHQAMLCQKMLYERSSTSQRPWDNWNKKISAIKSLEDSINDQTYGISDHSSAIQKFTKVVGRITVANMKIMLRRPPYPSELDAVPPWDDFDILRATTDVLEASMMKVENDDFEPWAWYTWVKWYALAVLLAELCHTSRDEHTTQRSYHVARKSFEHLRKLISDTEKGLLWKPITKLMQRVNAIGSHEQPLQYTGRCLPETPSIGLPGSHPITINHRIDMSYEEMAHQASINQGGSAPKNVTEDDSTPIDELETAMNGGASLDEQLSWRQWNEFLRDLNFI